MENNYPIRASIRTFMNTYDKIDLVGVEIGVDEGDNAECLLTVLPIRKLYLVDPWKTYEGFEINKEYRSYTNTYHTDEQLNKSFETAKFRLKKFGDKVEFIRKKSEDAIDDVPDELDFVYVDGNHRYTYVLKDLDMYYPKLKIGGWVCGNDYNMEHGGVVRAVREFIRKNKISGLTIGHNDWWVIKER